MATRLILATLCLVLAGCGSGIKPKSAVHIPREENSERSLAPRLQGIGSSALPIATVSTEAQAFFNQGISLIHGFWYYEALRAFEEVARLDGSCAMAYWGQYQALRRLGRDKKVQRQEALQRAKARLDRVSARERHFIRADVQRDSLGGRQGRQAYIREMQTLIAAYPDEEEAKLFLLRFIAPPGYDPATPIDPGQPDPHKLLTELLENHPDHAAVHHYWIHLIEATDTPGQALESAEKLAALAPNAGHLVHMPGHIYYRMGRYEQARDAFIRGVAVDSTYMAERGTAPVDTWNYFHNLSYLLANCAEDGRYREGRNWGRRIVKYRLHRRKPLLFYQGYMALVRLHLRYGFWRAAEVELTAFLQDEVVAETFARRYVDGVLTYARGMAALEEGDVEAAQPHIDMLDNMIWEYMAENSGGDDRFYSQKRMNVLTTYQYALQGAIYSAEGDHESAASLVQQGVDLEASLGYSEPPLFARPMLESLGQVHLRAGNWAEALRAFAQVLQERPKSGHALLGMARAHALSGATPEAEAAYRTFLKAWRHADEDLPQMMEAREWLARHGL